MAVVHRVADDAEAIALANDSPYGLGGTGTPSVRPVCATGAERFPDRRGRGERADHLAVGKALRSPGNRPTALRVNALAEESPGLD